MTSLADMKALALRELDTCRLLLDEHDWSPATVCEGWDVEALGRHLAAVAWQHAEAFHRARVHVTEPPSWLAVTGARPAVLDALAAGQAHLRTALDSVGDESRTVPLPFAPLPASIATAALVLEYGVHRADLERALLGAPDDTLDADVAAAIAPLTSPLLPVLAHGEPAAPITYRLVGDTVTATISWDGKTWRGDEGAEPVCQLRGSDAAISLLALGRIQFDHPSLAVDDPTGAAPALSTHVRGL